MAQNDQIQALIQEIDEVLSKTSPRLPWVMSTDAMRQRQVLEQARGCLEKLQIPTAAPEAIAAESRLLPSGQPAAESAQQVLQAVLQEMTYLRVNMLQPMRSDVDLLRQQREALTQEIRQLEAQRQQYVLPQGNPQLLMEFLQSAMGQMQENLRGQVTQMVASLAVEGGEPPLLQSANGLGGTDSLAIAALSPVQRLEQIQRVQTQSDQLLLKLDSTLQVIFESLQNNIQSYQESLEQGLSRMHSLGQQGEVMFSALVTRLAEQLGKEASAYLQAQVQAQPHPLAQPQILQGDRPSLAAKTAFDESADAEIARLLEELNAFSSNSANPPEPDALDTRWQPQPFTLESGSLEALDQKLQQLDLAALPLDVDIDNASDDDDLTFFQVDQELPLPKFSSEDTTRIQPLDEEEILDGEQPEANLDSASAPSSASEAVTESGFEDLDSALDLLNQLSAEAGVVPSPVEAHAVEVHAADTHTAALQDSLPADFRELKGISDAGSAAEAAEAIAPSLVDSPDSLYKDEFYQSLFGDATDEHRAKIPEQSDLISDLISDQASNLNGNLAPLPIDPSSETPEAANPLSFELDTENEVVQSLDLNEWFEAEALLAPPTNSLQSAAQDSGSTPAQAEAAPDLADNGSLLNTDLFGGVADPALTQPVRDAAADFLPDFPAAPVSQSVETFLLSEPPSTLESAALHPPISPAVEPPVEEDLFWQLAEEIQAEPEPEPVVVSPAGAAPADTIAALTDLIAGYTPSDPQGAALDVPEVGIPQIKIAAGEERSGSDAFEPAHPEEDLLIPAATPSMAIAQFEIGEDTLQQLTADLFSLELPGESVDQKGDPTPQADNLGNTLSTDPLADLYLKEVETPYEEAIDSQANQIASAITLEDLLFADGLTSLTPDLDQSPNPSSAHSQSVAEDSAADGADNAFTLEGLDTLFEGVPSILPPAGASPAATPDPEIPDSEAQPKKKA